MWGNLAQQRIRAAERDLASGRVDEAYRLASAPDLAESPRVQAMIQEIGERLFQRAEEHFKSGRYSEAISDLEKAGRGGVAPERISDLRTLIEGAVRSEVKDEHERRKRLDEAEQKLARGSLRGAEQILHGAPTGDSKVERLLAEAAERRRRGRELLDEVGSYLERSHWGMAVRRFLDAWGLDPQSPEAAEWEKTLVEKITSSVRSRLDGGDVRGAFEEYKLLAGIGESRAEKQSVRAMMEALAKAAGFLRNGDYEQARRSVLSLQHLLPNATWVRPVCEQLKQVDEAVTELHGGPLGLVPTADGGIRKSDFPKTTEVPASAKHSPVPKVYSPNDETLVSPPPRVDAGAGLPDKMLLIIDGSGSYLIVRSPRMTIGRAACEHPADIPITADLSERHAEIVRNEDDYFLFAQQDVRVGDQPVRQHLFQNGDKIILGRKVKMTFHVPSRKTATAVLDLGHLRLPRDVRRVILFDRVATIGRSSSSHVVVPTAKDEIVLFERDGRMWLKQQSRGSDDPGIEIAMRRPIEFAGMSLTLEEWNAKV